MLHKVAGCLCAPALFVLMFGLACAQIGGIEFYKNRKVGAEPPVIEAVLDQNIDALKKFWLNARQRFNDRDSQGRTALIVAALLGETEIIDFLISKGSNLGATDNAGNTALHYATSQGHTVVLERLITAGSKLNAQKPNGEVALFHAARKGHWAALEALLDAGADTQITDYTARGLMDYAQQAKNRLLMRRLKKRGL